MDPVGLRPLGVGEILDVAIKIYRSRFGVLVKSVSVVLGPVFLLGALVQLSIPHDDPLFGSTQPGGAPNFEADRFWSFLAATLLVSVLAFVASQLATGACFKAVAGAYFDEQPDWRVSLRFGRSRLRSLVWLSVLVPLLLFPATLAFLVPAIYLYVAWAVAAPVLLLEDVRGRAALKRSRALVRGRWWPALGVLVLVTLLVAIMQALFVGLFAGVVSVSSNEVAQAVAQGVVQMAASALTTPLSAAVLTVLYFDLRVRKEGFDLELLAHRLGTDPGSVATTDAPAPAPSDDDEAPARPPPWPPRDG